MLKDGILGDTYVFHFPTAEWARLNPDSDTDPEESSRLDSVASIGGFGHLADRAIGTSEDGRDERVHSY